MVYRVSILRSGGYSGGGSVRGDSTRSGAAGATGAVSGRNGAARVDYMAATTPCL